MGGKSVPAISYKYLLYEPQSNIFCNTHNSLVILKDTFANKKSNQDNTENWSIWMSLSTLFCWWQYCFPQKFDTL